MNVQCGRDVKCVKNKSLFRNIYSINYMNVYKLRRSGSVQDVKCQFENFLKNMGKKFYCIKRFCLAIKYKIKYAEQIEPTGEKLVCMNLIVEIH